MNEFFASDTPWSESDMEMRTLDGPPPSGFDCGADDQNSFFYDRAWRDTCRSISVTHVLYIKGILAGYVTLISDRISLGPKEKPKGVTYQFVPALKIAQLGVDRRFASRGLGKYLVGYSVATAMQWRGVIGCRYLTLDSQPDLVGWYEGQGMKRNKEEQKYREHVAREKGRSVEDLAISMRFDLRDARDYCAPEASET